MCTRVLFNEQDIVLTARSMDWNDSLNGQVYIMPRGLSKRSVANAPNPISWVSKYGSVGVVGYGISYADVMNECGLVVNSLYLAESDYGTDDTAKSVSLIQFSEFLVDNFATVAEVVDNLSKDYLRLVPVILPNGRSSTLHFSITDSDGDSAILEYLDGKLVINHNKNYRVMTNSPEYHEQLAILRYWEKIDGSKFVPGSYSAADRLVRASYLLNALPRKLSERYVNSLRKKTYSEQVFFSLLGIIRSVGVPLGIMDPELPNISSTIYRTISDSKNKKYYYESATSGSIFWIDLNEVDFNSLTTCMRLDGIEHEWYIGDMTNKLEVCKQIVHNIP